MPWKGRIPDSYSSFSTSPIRAKVTEPPSLSEGAILLFWTVSTVTKTW